MTSDNLDSKYLEKIKDVKYNPVFILGLHRSGTSILYKLLVATKHFNYVKARHLIRYNELLYNHFNNKEKEVEKELAQLFKKRGISDRKIDKLSITPDFAEEYGFLLTDLNYPVKLDNDNMEVFDKLCKKIQFLSNNQKPLLLKNPYDFPNFLYIKKHIPNAKFIFIHRNPLDVINSTMNAWQILLRNNDPYTPLLSKRHNRTISNPLLLYSTKLCYARRLPIGTLNVINQTTKATDYFIENIDKLSKKDYISIRYEDVCENPNTVISEIMKFLNQEVDVDLNKHINTRNLNLLPAVKFFREFLKRKMENYFTKFHYDIN